MKKSVLIPIFLSLVLAAFFSCTKDAQAPDSKDTNQSHILGMTKDKDSILNLTVSAEPSADGAVGERDGCTMYEAMRFTAYTGDVPDSADTGVYVNVEFRLIKINKTTYAQTALTNYQNISNVSGLNISWYNYSPLSDYWYAVGFKKCVLYGVGTTLPMISDFWSDNYMVQLAP